MTDHLAIREALEAGPTPGANAKYLGAFVAKIGDCSSCWLWIGSTSGRPGRRYGCFWNGKAIKAHQFAYEIFKGQRDHGKIVCHTCDVPLCVNPDHLYLGTWRDNVRDAVKRGRHRNGKESINVCPQGHDYTERNTYVYKTHRNCLACKDIRRGRTPKTL